jgi:serine/threonine protein kinase
MKAFHVGLHLESRGVSAARAVAVLQRRRWGVVRQSALFLEPAEGITLREFLLSRFAGLEEGSGKERLKGALLCAIAREVAALHASGVRQRDLKAPNILVAERGDRLDLTLLDLEGMELLGSPATLRVRLRDLARLAVSLREARVRASGIREDDWRFLVEEYFRQWRGVVPEPPEVEDFLRPAEAWARRKERRNQRRGRPIE